MTPSQILTRAADLMERTGFTPNACAIDSSGAVVYPHSTGATCFCVSGAARAVAFAGDDGDESPDELAYLSAMDAFVVHVGTETVREWADAPGRTKDDAVVAMRAVARQCETVNR